MAKSCPIGFDTKKLRDEVSSIYARVADEPNGEFHFHRGAQYAARYLRYDLEQLRALPTSATDSFAGVANPHRIAPISAGETVVDIGSGAGMDLLLAAKRVGPSGRAIGVDMTAAMRRRSSEAAREAGLAEIVDVRAGDAEELPLEDGEADVVISNGVLNLTTDKQRAFAEIYRVLKPGGRLQLADIVVGVALSEGARNDIDLWTGWIAGALQVAELQEVLESVGFKDVEVVEEFDPFKDTSKEAVTRKFGVYGVNVKARRP